jgi:hypothetical protein
MARQTIAILCLRACEYIIRVAVHFVPKADTALAVRSPPKLAGARHLIGRQLGFSAL